MKRFAILTAATVAAVGISITGCTGTKTGTNLGRAIDGNNYGAEGYYYYDDYYYPGTMADWNGRYYDTNGNRYSDGNMYGTRTDMGYGGTNGYGTRTDTGYGYGGANGYGTTWNGNGVTPATTTIDE